MSNTVNVDGVDIRFYNIYKPLIEPTEDEVTSDPFELRSAGLYSLLASKMTGAENDVYFKMQILDITKNEWQDAAQGGSVIKMWQNREIVTIGGVSAIVRFYKPQTTGQALGLSIGYYN